MRNQTKLIQQTPTQYTSSKQMFAVKWKRRKKFVFAATKLNNKIGLGEGIAMCTCM